MNSLQNEFRSIKGSFLMINLSFLILIMSDNASINLILIPTIVMCLIFYILYNNVNVNKGNVKAFKKFRGRFVFTLIRVLGFIVITAICAMYESIYMYIPIIFGNFVVILDYFLLNYYVKNRVVNSSSIEDI